MSGKSTYSHYYKKVPYGVEYVDVYRVLELFEVNDPAIQHAVKKLLVAGGRGHKNLIKDVEEAIISLNRWIDMRKEETPQTTTATKQLDIFELAGSTTVTVDYSGASDLVNSSMIG
jgi:hypothetical protein